MLELSIHFPRFYVTSDFSVIDVLPNFSDIFLIINFEFSIKVELNREAFVGYHLQCAKMNYQVQIELVSLKNVVQFYENKSVETHTSVMVET